MPKLSWYVAPVARSRTSWWTCVPNRRLSVMPAAMLTADDRNMLYAPEGCAHGFLTLNDDTEVFYQMSEFITPVRARGTDGTTPRSPYRGPSR